MSAVKVKRFFFVVICLNMVFLIIFVSVVKTRIMVDLRSFNYMEKSSRSTTENSVVDYNGQSSRSNGFVYSIKTESVIKTKHLTILKGQKTLLGWGVKGLGVWGSGRVEWALIVLGEPCFW